MSLKTSASAGSTFAPTPEGVYTARCFKIIDLGTQWVEWAGDKKQQRKVLITWELLDDKEKMEDGRPWAVTKKYTNSLDERGRLRPDLEAWRGKKFSDEELAEFDLKNVLGAYCTIQVVHSEDGKYANVNSIMSFKGEKPAPINEDVAFDIDEPDMKVFDTFSDRMKEQIEAADEWHAKLVADARKQRAEETDARPDTKEIEEVFGKDDDKIDLSSIPF